MVRGIVNIIADMHHLVYYFMLYIKYFMLTCIFAMFKICIKRGELNCSSFLCYILRYKLLKIAFPVTLVHSLCLVFDATLQMAKKIFLCSSFEFI